MTASPVPDVPVVASGAAVSGSGAVPVGVGVGQGIPGPTAGVSTCPLCLRSWTVTPWQDCLMPACGHYGTDSSAANPARPCEPCGLSHAWSCPDIKGRAS